MRRTLLLLITLLTAWTVVPAFPAYAQGRGGGAGQGGGEGDDQDADKKKKRNAEWELRQAPLPGKRNAGDCPFVKVLYDAARYEEFKDNKETSSAVAYTGEIDGLSSECSYKGLDPIKVDMRILFHLGRGPQGADSHKTYRYWVAVTHRNQSILAKEYFNLPITFPAGQDRVSGADTVAGIIIPRADKTINGNNFEILVGFDVTPQMAEFNELGKRFLINAGAPAAVEAKSGGK